MTEDLALLTAVEMRAGYGAGDFSPADVMTATLAAIDKHNPQLNAFRIVDREAALAAAKAATARWHSQQPQGLLDGIPITVKDVVLARNWSCLRGSKAVDPAGPWAEDAPAVARLREAGAIPVGMTTTPEFGWKGVTDSALCGITRNPWNPDKTPGGSSGGAAVAAATGMGALHIGTDGGGSVRIPAGFTGVPGLKPSFGRVPAYPASPFGSLSHLGPLARSTEDCALMLTIMAGPDNRDPHALPFDGRDYLRDLTPDLRGKRIAFSHTMGGHKVDPEIARLVDAAVALLAELGAQVETPEIAFPDLKDCFKLFWFSGAYRLLQRFTPDQQAVMEAGLRAVAAEGADYSLDDYYDAVSVRDNFTRQMQQLHQRYDFLVMPTLPLPAFEAGFEQPQAGDDERWSDWTPFTYPFNLTGQPAGSVPCGLTEAGLPAGLQIIGARYDDLGVLSAMAAYQQRMPTQFPPGAGSR
jgi:aspartyl-tRNA(Asn)/glutamyl-tRNA(Gln) amidotransferase subunit A